jgi:hypothetical protein
MDLCTKVKALPYNVYQQEGYSMVEQTLETRLGVGALRTQLFHLTS